MCEHKNIIVAHYANDETNMRIGCRIRCVDCDKYLFKSKDGGINLAYRYLEKNKNKFDTLIDYTCDNLNDRFNIKSGFNFKEV